MKIRLALAIALLMAVAVWWWLRQPVPAARTVPDAGTPAAAMPAEPRPQTVRRSMPPPALQLLRPASIRPTEKAIGPGRIEGMVINAKTGEGVAAAELTFSHDDGAYSTSTTSTGVFRFEPREAGVYRLISIEAKGYLPFERDFGDSPVSFKSWPGYDVSGVVIRLFPRRALPGLTNSRDAADVQRFLRAEPSAADGGLDAGSSKGVLFGRIHDARTGAPAAAFAIALWRRDGLSADAVAPASFVDPSGEYEIDGLTPGAYQASALSAGYARATFVDVQIGEGRTRADFALHSGAHVAGTVIDDATRQPLPGVRVTVEGRRGESPDLPVAPLSPETETGADGRFALDNVPPDTIGLQAEKAGYLVRFVSLGELPMDGDSAPVGIALTPKSAAADASFELTGIGGTLRTEGDALMILGVVPNGGAFEAGLAAGDRILSIDGVAPTSLDSSIAAIRGPEGTTVTLRIRRDGRDFDVRVTRKRVRG